MLVVEVGWIAAGGTRWAYIKYLRKLRKAKSMELVLAIRKNGRLEYHWL